MDPHLIDLLEKNKEKVQNKFDYLFIYIHWFIFHHFPQDQVIRKNIFLLKLCLVSYLFKDYNRNTRICT